MNAVVGVAWPPGPWELLLIVFVALLFFGRRLPETGRSLGVGIKEFRRGLRSGPDPADPGGAEGGGAAQSSDRGGEPDGESS